ncbi:MAG: hypothetical protein ACXAD7_08140 [Candidatus Kariarchaeaceae archaeon]
MDDLLSSVELGKPKLTDTIGNSIIQKKINDYLIRIIYRETTTDIIVITVYKTSKLEKYV